jgi:hypothetical protein
MTGRLFHVEQPGQQQPVILDRVRQLGHMFRQGQAFKQRRRLPFPELHPGVTPPAANVSVSGNAQR